MNILAAIYISSGGQTSQRAWKHEIVRRRWTANGTERTVEALFNMGQGMYMPRILLFAPTNNAVNVLEDLLLDVIPLINAVTQRWDLFCPYYRRIQCYADIRNVPHANC